MNWWQRRSWGRNVMGVLLWFAAASISFIVVRSLHLFSFASELPTVSGLDNAEDRFSLFVAILGATLIVGHYFDRFPSSSLGLMVHRWTTRELLQGGILALVGALLVWTPFLVSGEVIVGQVTPSEMTNLGALAVLLTIFAITEELLFRGYLFQRVVELFGAVPATLMFAAGFGLIHLSNPGMHFMAGLNVALASILFSILYFRTGSLWMPIGYHVVWNCLLLLVFGVRMSGISSPDSLFVTELSRSLLLTGGEFGPEGSIITTIVLILSTLFVVRSKMIRFAPWVYATTFRDVYRRRVEASTNGADRSNSDQSRPNLFGDDVSELQ